MSESVLAWSSAQPITMRDRLHEEDGRRCHYCQEDLALADLTIDHIVPKAFGGLNHHSNYVGCCRRCNGEWGAAVRKCACKKCERALEAHLRNYAGRAQGAASRVVQQTVEAALASTSGGVVVTVRTVEHAFEQLRARLLEVEAQLEGLLSQNYSKDDDPEAAALAGKCKGIRVGLRYLKEITG